MSVQRAKAIPRKPILLCVLREVPLCEPREWALVFLLPEEAKGKLQRKSSRSKRNSKENVRDGLLPCLLQLNRINRN